MGLRHLGRELALKALYRIDICGGASSDDLAVLFESFAAEESARKFAVALMEGVRREQVALDKHLADALEHWSVKRLSRVDHNIMRIALYELLRMEDIPARVTIDERLNLQNVTAISSRTIRQRRARRNRGTTRSQAKG